MGVAGKKWALPPRDHINSAGDDWRIEVDVNRDVNACKPILVAMTSDLSVTSVCVYGIIIHW